MGCDSCKRKKKHHKKKKKKHHSSSDSDYFYSGRYDPNVKYVKSGHHEKVKKKKPAGHKCVCCDECLCYKYGGIKDWKCKCGCKTCCCK